MKTSAVLLVLAACFLLLSQAAPGDRRCRPLIRAPCVLSESIYVFIEAKNKCEIPFFGACIGPKYKFKSREECEEVCVKTVH
ncbi:protease inhibitor 4-like [Dendropsophus ebraccatus]|uniref:protease inhibitor 4-like n=1 Tax=Dendropsophus ebraccatus TaxID=150705 RepID=UPI0038319422